MKTNVVSEIDALLEKLHQGFDANDLANGWTEQSQRVAIKYLSDLKSALISSRDLPPLGIVRGLDHWGVTGGDLLESIARVTNKLR